MPPTNELEQEGLVAYVSEKAPLSPERHLRLRKGTYVSDKGTSKSGKGRFVSGRNGESIREVQYRQLEDMNKATVVQSGGSTAFGQ